MMCNRISLAASVILFTISFTHAQSLDPLYESNSMGIAIRPPAGCKFVRTEDPEEMLMFVDEGRKWSVRITRTMLEKPIPLTEKEAMEDPNFKEGAEPVKTYLDHLVEQFLATSGDAQLLRQEDELIGKRRLGLLAIRHTLTGEHRLRQQAVLQQTKKVYYSVELSTPGAKPNTTEETPQEIEARDVFRQMLNTVRLIDQTAIREDQDDRLFRTRSWFMQLNESTLSKPLVAEQYLRHLKNGKDIGYSYRVEEPYESAGQKGFHIGIRSRMMSDDGKQIDSERWYFSTWDRRHEDFSCVIVTDDGKEQTSVNELGVSNRETQRILDKTVARGDGRDPKQPGVMDIERPTLSVSIISKTERRPPIELRPPVWYIPLALGDLLPRVIPQDPKTYLVAVWVSDRQKVLLQYVDVGREEMTMLGEQSVRGLPVRTKIGLEGVVTTTYVTRDGKFLGSINEEDKTMTLPSTEQELLGIWKNANLTRPKALGK